jgi:hypothetical protein
VPYCVKRNGSTTDPRGDGDHRLVEYVLMIVAALCHVVRHGRNDDASTSGHESEVGGGGLHSHGKMRLSPFCTLFAPFCSPLFAPFCSMPQTGSSTGWLTIANGEPGRPGVEPTFLW